MRWSLSWNDEGVMYSGLLGDAGMSPGRPEDLEILWMVVRDIQQSLVPRELCCLIAC
jgi:hypothetical protein